MFDGEPNPLAARLRLLATHRTIAPVMGVEIDDQTIGTAMEATRRSERRPADERVGHSPPRPVTVAPALTGKGAAVQTAVSAGQGRGVPTSRRVGTLRRQAISRAHDGFLSTGRRTDG